jgi:hypothetical protein
MIVIRIVGDALGRSTPFDGKYIKSFDPDAHDGRGAVTATAEPTDALQFASTIEALALWKQPSKVHPLRSDGKPNRPLTAYSVELEPV